MWGSVRTLGHSSAMCFSSARIVKPTSLARLFCPTGRPHSVKSISHIRSGLMTRTATSLLLESSSLSSSSPTTSRVLARHLATAPDGDPAKPADGDPFKEQQKLSLYQRFKAMYKDYWYVLIPVHVATSCVWFGAFFYTAQSGFDIAGALEILNLSEEIMDKVRSSANSTAGHITISYLLYKIFTPLRYTVTLGGATYTIKYLTARGLLRKMPKREELQKMMVDGKDSLKDKKDSLKKEIVGKFSPKKNLLPPLEQPKAQ